jgi:hypothetical protein
MSEVIHLSGEWALDYCVDVVMGCPLDGSYEVTIRKLPQTRTAKQNRALHAYCRLLSENLVESGHSIQEILAAAYDRQWTPTAVKELLWRPIQVIMIDKESTTDANRGDYGIVHEQLQHHLGEKFGVPYIPWPTQDQHLTKR